MLLKNCKNIFLFGIGQSGYSALEYFINNKTNIIAWDDNKFIRKKLKKNFLDIKIKNLKSVDWKSIDFVLVSPGISFGHLLLKYPKKFNIPLYRDLEIFSQKVNKRKIIALTGTNGKSTTVSLIGKMISKKNKNVFIGGNIKPPLIDALKIKSYFKYILELSSYQLESAPSFNSHISILLNIAEDHLDRYGSLENYALIKKKIFRYSDSSQFSIISIDDSLCNYIYKELKLVNINTIPISVDKRLKKGIFFSGLRIIDKYFSNQIIDLSDKKNKFFIDNNKQNILATYAVSKILGYTNIFFIKILENFKALNHRSETIYRNKKIIVINDSKSTNLASTFHSIKSHNNIHLIMGGKLKNKEFNKLKLFKNKINRIYLIGESSSYIYKQIKDTFICDSCKTMNIAVKKSFNEINKNNVFSTLLLSPACSSFDQYNNYEERGDDFTNISKKLIKKFYE